METIQAVTLCYTQRPDRKGTERSPLAPFTSKIILVTLKDPIERGLKGASRMSLPSTSKLKVTLKDPIERGLKVHLTVLWE